MRPSQEEVQNQLNETIKIMLKMSENIPQWEHMKKQQRQQQKDLESGGDDKEGDVKINPQSMVKPLHKLVAEHKDVVKIVIQLNSIISILKPDIQDLLGQFSTFSELWDEVGTY